MVSIGDSSVSTSFAFAPMLGISDFPTRLWIACCGTPPAMTAPYVRATAAGLGQKDLERSLPELTSLRGVLPYVLTPQILGTDPAALAGLARKLKEISPVVEVNCGCPTPSAAGPYAGSGILREPKRLRALITILVDSIGAGSCAFKCRVGYDDASEWPQIFEAIHDLPLTRLSIHGRTRAEGYHGRSRWRLIGKAAMEASYPVWLSGDLKTRLDYEDVILQAPEISGVLIGRGALADPFIFAQLLSNQQLPDQKVRRLAIVAYALIHDVWLKKPERLLARLTTGKFIVNCGADDGRWQEIIQLLMSILGAPPCELDDDELRQLIGGVTRKRLRTLLGYMSPTK